MALWNTLSFHVPILPPRPIMIACSRTFIAFHHRNNFSGVAAQWRTLTSRYTDDSNIRLSVGPFILWFACPLVPCFIGLTPSYVRWSAHPLHWSVFPWVYSVSTHHFFFFQSYSSMFRPILDRLLFFSRSIIKPHTRHLVLPATKSFFSSFPSTIFSDLPLKICARMRNP